MTAASARTAAVRPAAITPRVGPALGWATFVVALVGVGLSIYLTYEHFTGAKSFACPASSTVNCEKVTTSAWSEIWGMPVAVLGLVFFVGMAVLVSPWLWQFRQLDWLRVLGAVVGICTALYLVWAELFRIKAICLYCTGVHVVSLVLLVLVLWTTSEARARDAGVV